MVLWLSSLVSRLNLCLPPQTISLYKVIFQPLPEAATNFHCSVHHGALRISQVYQHRLHSHLACFSLQKWIKAGSTHHVALDLPSIFPTPPRPYGSFPTHKMCLCPDNYIYGDTGAWTQGLHLEPLHQPLFIDFFLMNFFFKIGSLELFA
jgi:hypothetical protein